ncbi:unnamed protein product [Caenorhabditis brenneri]
MAVFNGTVNPIKNCVLVDAKNGTDCIVQCGKKSNCLLSFMDVGECNHCYYGNLSSVTRESSKHMIGLKVTSSLFTLTQERSLLWSSLETSHKGDTCPHGTIRLKTCEDGWQLFRRNTAWVCLKVVFKPNNMTQPNAKQACINESANIGGLETVEELKFAAAITDAKMRSENSSRIDWAIWIDGERKNDCKTNKTAKELKCNSTNAFIISDSTVLNKAGYIWSDNEPNGSKFNITQDCVILLTNRNSYDPRYGKLDDLRCNDTAHYDKKGVLCVKDAGWNVPNSTGR